MHILNAFTFPVATADNAETVENQANDEPQASRFTWTIENFSRVNVKKLYSDIFVVGGYKWYLTAEMLLSLFVYIG